MIKLYDRSRVVADWTCRRRRYLNYEIYRRGIVPNGVDLALYEGQTIHDGLAAIAHLHQEGKVDIDLVAETAAKQMFEALSADDPTTDGIQFAHEQASLVEGMLRGFYIAVWPSLIRGRKIKMIEQEILFRHDLEGRPAEADDFVFMSKPDLVLENPDGSLLYVEYKTTSSKKDSWINSWNTAIQLHSAAYALRQHGKVEGAIVQGLYKGYESYGKQTSPFCYAYHRQETAALGLPKIQLSYEYKAGWRKVPVWELEGGVKQWIENMPATLLVDQFPRTPVIYIKDALVEAFFRQRAIREVEIDLANQMMAGAENDPESTPAILNAAFPQEFSECTPSWGHPCPYRHVCFAGVTDPLDRGYVLREPHHTFEKEIWNAKEVKGNNAQESVCVSSLPEADDGSYL